MAVVVTSNPTGLKMKYNLGNDPISGRVITRSKTYTSLNPEAADQDIFDVANVIGSLQTYPIMEIARIDNSTLSA